MTNSSKLEMQVSKDAQFWLPLVKREHMTWLNEESRLLVPLPKNIDEFWALNQAVQDNVLAAWFTIYRKGRKIDGQHLVNDSLYVKAVAFQRLGRIGNCPPRWAIR